jgi:Ca2+-binding RTX toxin-like protein
MSAAANTLSTGLTIKLRHVANAGAPENFENLPAGAGPDTLTGNDGANGIDGGTGNDTLWGDKRYRHRRL